MKLKESDEKIYQLCSEADFMKCEILPGFPWATVSFGVFARKYYYTEIVANCVIRFDNHGHVFRQYLIPKGEVIRGKK